MDTSPAMVAPSGSGRDVVVLLGDPRRPYSYNPGGRIAPHDFDDLQHLKAALTAIPGVRMRFLDDHDRFTAALAARRPDLVLNFCNTGLYNNPDQQHLVAALLDGLRIPYVGADTRCMALCHDKAAVAALAAQHGVPVPREHLVKLTPGVVAPDGPYPAIIKPNDGDGSIGIESRAVAPDRASAQRYLRQLAHGARTRCGSQVQWALVQEWLDVPEYSVALIGNPDDGFAPLPPLEVDFSGLPPGELPVLTYASKTDPRSVVWQGVELRPARLGDAAREQMIGHCRTLFERLGCRDYARFDLRAGADGIPRVIDVNAHPMWGQGGMMAAMARFGGHDYGGFLQLILEAGLKRFWRTGALMRTLA